MNLNQIGNPVYQTAKSLVISSKIWDGAAALTFYIVLAVFPGLLSVMAVSAFVGGLEITQTFSQWWVSYLPGSAQELIGGVVMDLSEQQKSMSLLSIAFAFSVWSSTTGVVAVIRQLNRIYDVSETRSFLQLRMTAFFISLLIIVSMVVAFVLIIAGGFILSTLSKGLYINLSLIPLANIMRYVGATLVFFLGFLSIYFIGPVRRIRLRSVWKGALVASLLFVLFSYSYTKYLGYVGGLSATYGGLGALIGFLMWLYFLSLSMLVGAKLNSAIEP